MSWEIFNNTDDGKMSGEGRKRIIYSICSCSLLNMNGIEWCFLHTSKITVSVNFAEFRMEGIDCILRIYSSIV